MLFFFSFTPNCPLWLLPQVSKFSLGKSGELKPSKRIRGRRILFLPPQVVWVSWGAPMHITNQSLQKNQRDLRSHYRLWSKKCFTTFCFTSVLTYGLFIKLSKTRWERIQRCVSKFTFSRSEWAQGECCAQWFSKIDFPTKAAVALLLALSPVTWVSVHTGTHL